MQIKAAFQKAFCIFVTFAFLCLCWTGSQRSIIIDWARSTSTSVPYEDQTGQNTFEIHSPRVRVAKKDDIEHKYYVLRVPKAWEELRKADGITVECSEPKAPTGGVALLREICISRT